MSDISVDDLARLDDSEITREHWKIMFISGMGFFTDAYDLFIIGVAMHLIKEQWHTSPFADGLVTSTALLASAVGALLFGRVADMLGRKRISTCWGASAFMDTRCLCSPRGPSPRRSRPTSGG